MRTLYIGAFVLVALAGCDFFGDEPNWTEPLGTTAWSLVSVIDLDQGVQPVPDTEWYEIRFYDDGRVGARIDCNTGGGRYQLSPLLKLRLTIEPLTFHPCPPALIGDQFIGWIAAVRRIEYRGEERLELATADGRRLLFVRVPFPFGWD